MLCSSIAKHSHPHRHPTVVRYELIGARLPILAGNGRGLPFDYDELERWRRLGYERGMRFRKGER